MTQLKNKNSLKVRTRLNLSLRVKLLIGAGIFVVVAGVIIFIVINTTAYQKGKAQTNVVFYGSNTPNAYFDATPNSYIDFGLAQNLNCINLLPTGNSFSASLWVKWDDLSYKNSNKHSTLFTLADSAGNFDNGIFWIQHDKDNTHFEFSLKTGSVQTITSTTTPTVDTWYFLTCVYDGSLANQNLKFYINGTLEGSANLKGNLAAISSSAKLMIGSSPNPREQFRKFKGYIDDVSMWNRALTAQQINTLMTTPRTLTGATYNATALKGYWNFDDNTAGDLTGCNNDGTAGSGTTLPVELINFSGNAEEGVVNLQWSTASEINNESFAVEQSSDGKNFTKIGEVKGAGNTNSVKDYSFTDKSPKAVNYYRLKQTDFDGKSEILPTIVIKTKDNADDEGKITAGPNPFVNFINVNYQSSSPSMVEVGLYDMSGKVIIKEQVEVEEGSNVIPLNIELDIPNGFYFVGVTKDGKRSPLVKVVKTK